MTFYVRASAALLAAIAAAGLLMVVMLVWHKPASALRATAVPGTTITVNSKGDGTATGNCTLREAITAANTNAQVDACPAGSATDRDAIHFSLGPEATIVLGSQLPTVSDSEGLNINGLRSKITVSGNDSVRVFHVGPGARLTLINLTVADGRTVSPAAGAGLLNESGTVKVLRSTFSGNRVTGILPDAHGGGIYNLGPATLAVNRSTFSDNSAEAGAGIYNRLATLAVTNSTFSGNDAENGGGIYNAGTLTVTSSTFSGNSAVTSGGGVLNAEGGAATTTLSNTIVAHSPRGNCSGTIIDGGYNIDNGPTCNFSAANNSHTLTNPFVDPDGLQDNGGPTKTIALLEESPAIDAIPEGTNGCGTQVKTDQRGVVRPRDEGCDIGAFERAGAPPS